MSTTTKPPRPASKADMRPFYTAQITKLLTREEELTRRQIAAKLGINENTLSNYLTYMRDELCAIRHSGQFLHGRPLWELGEDTRERRVCEPVEDMLEQRNIVPARQVGMWRDGLVAALFGPPPQLLTVSLPCAGFSKPMEVAPC